MIKEKDGTVVKLSGDAPKESIDVMLQVGKEDLANIAVSQLENKLHEFVANKQKILKELQDRSTEFQTKMEASFRSILETVRTSRAVEEAKAAFQSVLLLQYSERQIDEFNANAAYVDHQMTYRLNPEEVANNFATGKSIVHVHMTQSAVRKGEGASSMQANFCLVAEALPQKLIQSLSADAVERQKLIHQASEVSTQIAHARTQLADMDRIVREAKSAVARVALQNTTNGEKLMEVINQIPGFERLTKLIGQ